MAETKQISATIDLDLANWVSKQAEKEKRTYSQMIGLLLEDAKELRTKKEKAK